MRDHTADAIRDENGNAVLRELRMFGPNGEHRVKVILSARAAERRAKRLKQQKLARRRNRK